MAIPKGDRIELTLRCFECHNDCADDSATSCPECFGPLQVWVHEGAGAWLEHFCEEELARTNAETILKVFTELAAKGKAWSKFVPAQEKLVATLADKARQYFSSGEFEKAYELGKGIATLVPGDAGARKFVLEVKGKLDKLRELDGMIDRALVSRDFRNAKALAFERASLNPRSSSLTKVPVEVDRIMRIYDELKKGKSSAELFRIISRIQPEIAMVPADLKKYFETDLNVALRKIENEKTRLRRQIESAKGSFSKAADLLTNWKELTREPSELNEIANLESNLKERLKILRRKRRIRLAVVSLVLLILTVYVALVPLPQYLGKREIAKNIALVNTLTAGRKFAEIPGIAREIFETRSKLSANEALDKEIDAALLVPFQELERLSVEAGNKGDLDLAIEHSGLRAEIFRHSQYPPGGIHFYLAEKRLKDLVFRKYFAEGQRLHGQKKLDEALKNLLIAKEAVPGEEINRTIDSVRKEIKLRDLNSALKQARQKRNIEDFLKTLMKIEDLTEKRDSHFVHLREFASPSRNGGLRIILRGIPFILVRGGGFLMGCMETDCSGNEDAFPRHAVRLNDFWMSETEITVEQYNGSPGKLPACMNWREAKTFAYGIAREFSIGCDLPTEAQWEYASRNGGKENVFPWGAVAECRFANYRSCGSAPKQVASYPPNSLGLFDMAGNVREWCQDIYVEGSDPTMNFARAPMTTMRSVRGGSYGDGANALKTFSRYYLPESQRDNKTGIRLIIDNEGKSAPIVSESSSMSEKSVAEESMEAKSSQPAEESFRSRTEAEANALAEKNDKNAEKGEDESTLAEDSNSSAQEPNMDYESGIKFFQDSKAAKMAGNLKSQEENLQKAFDVFKNEALFGNYKALLMYYLSSVYLGKYFYMKKRMEFLVGKEYPDYKTLDSIEVIDNTEKAIIREKLNQVAIILKMNKKKK